MPWVPSHTSLARHPKLKRAARIAGVNEPAMIGHLHLLWWWALELAPDGDLSGYDIEDIADAAGWQGEPDRFFDALLNAGPGQSSGFIEPTFQLHDWQEYGGRYGKRVAAARKAAAARWSKEANAEPSQSERKQQRKRGTLMTEDWQPDEANVARLQQKFPKLDIAGQVGMFRDFWLSKGEARADWNAGLRTWCAKAEQFRLDKTGEKVGGWR